MYTFVTILTVLSLVMIICIIRTYRSDEPIAIPTRRLMISALFPVASNIMVAVSTVETVSIVGYLIYFISTDWMLAYALRFVGDYCGYKYSRTGWEKIVGLLCGVDTLILALDPVFNHVFNLNETILDNGSIYYTYSSIWYHYVHLGFSYIMTAVVILMLVVKLVKTSYLYRERYLVMLFSAFVVAIWELYYVVNPSLYEYSMVAYAIFPVLIYFFALEYKSYIATYRMFNEVITNIGEAIFFFDPDNKCIYLNQRGKDILAFLDKTSDDAWDYAVEIVAGGDVYSMEDILTEGYYQSVRDYTVRGQKFTYDLELHRILDKKNHPVGFFITAKDRTEEQRRIDKERYQATHDGLTGLYNEDYLYTRVEKQLIENPNQRYVIAVSDIKGFKMVNDIYGREVGDEVLKKIAGIISGYATGDTLYGRIGSDKFGIMVRREKYSESIFSNDIQTITHMKQDMFYPIIVHVGIYEVTDRRIPPSVMFDRAFMALKTIKNDMQKRVAYYDVNLRESMLWEQRITGSIDEGLDSRQIMPYMQPQVTGDGVILGVELLARWMHPTEGFLKPKRFLPTLEKNGYIVKLDQYMWECACRIIKKWESKGRDDLYVSVNISPVDFFFADVVDILTALIEKYDVDPKKLRLEITEHTMMHDAKRRIEVIEELRDKGFIVEMDDFGNGFSSLNMLKDIPIDVIKIDMAFLEETRDIERAKQILESMMMLAKHLDIPVITEGVESREQLDFLTGMGCDLFQGFYFAQAMPEEEFEEKYLERK